MKVINTSIYLFHHTGEFGVIRHLHLDQMHLWIRGSQAGQLVCQIFKLKKKICNTLQMITGTGIQLGMLADESAG
jgi:hypothetical protein